MSKQTRTVIALADGASVSLTEKEVGTVRAILDSEYGKGDEISTPWVSSVTKRSHAAAGTLSTLIAKRVIFTERHENPTNGKKAQDRIVGFTTVARPAIRKHFVKLPGAVARLENEVAEVLAEGAVAKKTRTRRSRKTVEAAA